MAVNKIILVAWLITLVHVGSEETGVEERHNGSEKSCEEIKQDYYETRDIEYANEYIHYCKEVWRRHEEKYRKDHQANNKNKEGLGG